MMDELLFRASQARPLGNSKRKMSSVEFIEEMGDGIQSFARITGIDLPDDDHAVLKLIAMIAESKGISFYKE